MPHKAKQVLFVDDDAHFLEILQNVMAHYAGASWEVHTAMDVGQALTVLQERHIDLLVIDVHMPVVDGLQFLGLLRRTYPDLLRVVLTGDASEAYRAACLNAGAELFLEKPVSQDGWQSIFATLNGLTKLQPEEGFRGVLRRVGLPDILQMECLGRSSSVLEVSVKGFQGRIFIREGQIIHAEAGERTGEEAFNYLMGLKGGEFNLQPFVEPPTQTIQDSWEFLLMEAARKRDEAGESSAVAPAAEVKPAVAAARAAPAPTPAPPVPRAAPEMKEVPRLHPHPEPESSEAETSRPLINEVLIASPQGDVLYEWQCPQVTERIRFLEFLSDKARLLCQGLPLGDFDRLEAESGAERIVIQMQPDRTLLVRRTAVAADVAA
jgi:CheY-like chemotaxis protein